MPLPTSLLQQVEQHGCFTGCYSHESSARLCLDPSQSLQPALLVSCLDCLSFKVGVLQALLPAGTTTYTLADQLSLHNRQLRGYSVSFSGYHARGPGFWLSAAYYPHCGLFLLDGERSRSLGSDLDLLLLAFKHGVAQPPDPRMVDPRFYTTQVAYVNFAGVSGPFANRQALLASPQCQAQPQKGFHRVTLAEFQPRAAQPNPAAPAAGTAVQAAISGKPASAKAKGTPAQQLKVGDVCPVCHAEVRLRPLLHGTYVGCLC
jgi:hypothetical protein